MGLLGLWVPRVRHLLPKDGLGFHPLCSLGDRVSF